MLRLTLDSVSIDLIYGQTTKKDALSSETILVLRFGIVLPWEKEMPMLALYVWEVDKYLFKKEDEDRNIIGFSETWHFSSTISIRSKRMDFKGTRVFK